MIIHIESNHASTALYLNGFAHFQVKFHLYPYVS